MTRGRESNYSCACCSVSLCWVFFTGAGLRELNCGPHSYIKKLLSTPGPENERRRFHPTGGMRLCCYPDLTESLLSVLMVSISISRHKRNLGARQLADYRPYWFARDLRGSKGTKVRARAGARASVDI